MNGQMPQQPVPPQPQMPQGQVPMQPQPQPPVQPPQQQTLPQQPVQPQPAAQQFPPLAFPTGQHNKVHNSYVWLNALVGAGAALLVVFFTNISSIFEIAYALNMSDIVGVLGVFIVAILLFLLIFGLVVLIQYLAYRNLSFVFDEQEFSLYSGIVTKRRVHVPYARVQSVNHNATLFQRLAGVCSVSIDTAGGAANKAVRVPYVTLATGEQIRSDLFVRKAMLAAQAQGQAQPETAAVQPDAVGTQAAPAQPVVQQPMQPGQPYAPAQPAQPGQPYAPAQPAQNVLDAMGGAEVANWRGVFGGNVAGMEPITFETGLTNKQLAFTGTTGSVLEGVVGTVVTLALVLMALGGLPEFGRYIIPVAAIAIPGLAIFIWGSTVLATVVAYGNFRVRRRGTRVEVERGLLQRSFSGMDLDRIQSVMVTQSLVRRIMGYCEISLGRVEAAGDVEAEGSAFSGGALVVHPFIKVNQVESFLEQLLPEFGDMPTPAQLTPLPNVAMRRGILRNCFWQNGMFFTAILVAIVQVVLHVVLAPYAAYDGEIAWILSTADGIAVAVYVLALLSIPIKALGSVWWKRGSGFVVAQRYAAIRVDGLRTAFVVMPRQKIQGARTTTNPFQRRARVATISAWTAAGTHSTNAQLWDVSHADAVRWLEWLQPRTQLHEHGAQRN